MTLTAEIVAGAFTLLLAGNFFFIKRLIDKIEKTANVSAETKHSLKILGTRVRHAGRTLTEIKSELRAIRVLEIDVAVLKSYLNGGEDLPKHS